MEIDCGDMFEYAMALDAIDKINNNSVPNICGVGKMFSSREVNNNLN